MLKGGKVVGAGISREVYSKQDAKRGEPGFIMSRGELMEFDRCPARWLAGMENDETKSTEWGSLIDCMILTPDQFDSRFAVCPATYPGKDGDKPWIWSANFCKEWRDRRPGLTPVKADDFEKATAAIDRIHSDKEIHELLMGSEKQVMVVSEWHDEATGIVVPTRILLDILPLPNSRFSDSIADFKTCADAMPKAWGRAVWEHEYHVQAKLYRDVWKAATGEDRKYFLHAIQESFPPYQVGHRVLIDGGMLMDKGKTAYGGAFERYCQCLKTGIWPGFERDDGISQMILNGWQEVSGELWMVK